MDGNCPDLGANYRLVKRESSQIMQEENVKRMIKFQVRKIWGNQAPDDISEILDYVLLPHPYDLQGMINSVTFLLI